MSKQILLGIIFFGLSLVMLVTAGFVYSRNSEKYLHIPVISSIGQKLPGATAKTPLPKQDTLAVLLLGVGGEGHDGGDLTDTIMVAQIDNLHQRIQLISIPRDMLVFDDNGAYKKINSVYSFEKVAGKDESEAIQTLSKTVTEITGIPINHYARIDFDGFKQMVDAIGGIEIEVFEDINDPYYPGPNYSYDPFIIDAGVHQMSGETALKYSRTRYTSKNGDFDRASRQQQIVTKFKDQVLTLNPVTDIRSIISLVNLFGKTVDTDLSIAQMRKLYDTYNDIDNYQMNSIVIGEDLLQGSLVEDYRMFGRSRGYVLVPRAGEKNYYQIREEIRNASNKQEYQQEHQHIFTNQPHTLEIVTSFSRQELSPVIDLLKAKGYQVKIVTDTASTIPSDKNVLIVPPTEKTTFDTTQEQPIYHEETYLEREFNATKQIDESIKTKTLYLQEMPDWFQPIQAINS